MIHWFYTYTNHNITIIANEKRPKTIPFSTKQQGNKYKQTTPETLRYSFNYSVNRISIASDE